MARKIRFPAIFYFVKCGKPFIASIKAWAKKLTSYRHRYLDVIAVVIELNNGKMGELVGAE